MPRKKNLTRKSKPTTRKARRRANAKATKKGTTMTKLKPNAPQPGRLAFVAAANETMPADQIVQMFSDCISHVTGNANKIDLGSTLQPYGFDMQHQVDTFSGYVIGSADFGVKHYAFSLSADALNWVTNTTQLGKLLDFIQDKAVPS